MEEIQEDEVLDEKSRYRRFYDEVVIVIGRGWRIFKRVFVTMFPFLNIALAALFIYIAMTGNAELGDVDDIRGIAIDWRWITVAVAMIYLMIPIEMLRMHMTMRLVRGKGGLVLCSKNFVLSRFYALVTPMYSGTLPAQLVYLNKKCLSVADTTSVVLSNYITGRIGFQVLTGGILLATFHLVSQLDGGAVVGTSIVVGILFNVLFTVLMLVTLFGRRIIELLTRIIVGLGLKMRIIKDKDGVTRRARDLQWQYRVAMMKLRRRPGIMVGSVILHMMYYFLHLGVVIPIYASLNGWDWGVIPLLLLGIVLAEYTGTLVPLPGGTGGFELFFLTVFATIFGGPQVVMAVILWRIITYILPIANGIPVIMWEWGISIRERRKSQDMSCINSEDML